MKYLFAVCLQLVQAPQHSNFDLILKYLTHFESDRCIVFTNTKSKSPLKYMYISSLMTKDMIFF